MSKLNRSEFKELLIEWRKSLVNEANRVIMSDPGDFIGYERGLQSSRIQSSLMSKEIEDMTHLSVEDTLKKLINVADENVFVHFLTKSNKLDNSKITSDEIKTFSVNPSVNWGNQQGIFSYKLDRQGLVNLIEKGKPASGGYGTNSSYFQVFKIDDSRTITIYEKDENIRVKLPISLYPISNKSLQDKLESLIKNSFHLISNDKSKNVKANIPFKKNITKLYLKALSSQNSSDYIPIIIKNIELEAKKNISYHDNEKNSETKFVIKLKFYIDLISDVISYINETTSAQYGSLLWHLLGVENIDDQGTGFIHGSEKSQAVSFDFSGDSLKPIGTFKNYFKDVPIGQYYRMFLNIINDENVNWDFNITNKKFNEISDPREWDLRFLKKMLKQYPPSFTDVDDDIWYFWNDSMEGALWAFSEHEDKDTGLLLLKYVIDNCPILKDRATHYYNQSEADDRDNEYWKSIENRYYKY